MNKILILALVMTTLCCVESRILYLRSKAAKEVKVSEPVVNSPQQVPASQQLPGSQDSPNANNNPNPRQPVDSNQSPPGSAPLSSSQQN